MPNITLTGTFDGGTVNQIVPATLYEASVLIQAGTATATTSADRASKTEVKRTSSRN